MPQKTVPLARFPDWDARLSAYLETRSDWTFKWGQHDCASFIAGAVTAMTGVDVYADFRGIYDSQEGSKEALQAVGSGTLYKTVAKWLKKSKHISQAMRGDVVMKDDFTLGICMGRWAYFVGSEGSYEGIVHEPIYVCKKAFTIPFTYADGEMAAAPSLGEAA